MIVMREILNVKQTQVHPGETPAKGGGGKHSWTIFRIGRAQRNKGREKGTRDRGFQSNFPFLHLIQGFESRLRGLYGQKSAAAPKESSFSVSFAHACC